MPNRLNLARNFPRGGNRRSAIDVSYLVLFYSDQMETSMPFAASRRTPPCVTHAGLYQHPLLEEPPTSRASVDVRRRADSLAQQARQLCADCPLRPSCLYDAVVGHDVAGFVAGTSERERAAVRRTLAVTVEPEDFDSLAGIIGGRGPVNHDEVVRLRAANPHESLETLARRLGCSLSTVKRHLRAERNGTTRPPQPRTLPDQGAVLLACAQVTGARETPQPIAA